MRLTGPVDPIRGRCEVPASKSLTNRALVLAAVTVSEPLFSPSWYRVATLKPRIRSHARIHRHVYRSAPWFVLQDPSTGQYHRLNPAAHELIALMDGERTIQKIWELA